MLRRWLIRCFFLVLLVLSVGGWVSSYWRSVEVSHTEGSSQSLRTYRGLLILDSSTSTHEGGWSGRIVDAENGLPWDEAGFTGKRFLGFASGRAMSQEQEKLPSSVVSHFYVHKVVEVPFWCIVILTAAAAYFAWRKTVRPRLGKELSDRTGKRTG